MFAQRGGNSDWPLPPYDRSFWKDMECFQCLQKRNQVLNCTNTIDNEKVIKNDDDKPNSSKSSISSKTSKTSKLASITKLQNSQIKMKKGVYNLEYNNWRDRSLIFWLNQFIWKGYNKVTFPIWKIRLVPRKSPNHRSTI